VAIANSRLLKLKEGRVTFRWKDYRRTGENAHRTMTLSAGDFMRRFLLHVLPDGFHRIRHYGLFANGHRAKKIDLCRKLLGVPRAANDNVEQQQQAPEDQKACPCCGGHMVIIETFDHSYTRPKYHQGTERLDGL
jgi:hypothetical protein